MSVCLSAFFSPFVFNLSCLPVVLGWFVWLRVYVPLRVSVCMHAAVRLSAWLMCLRVRVVDEGRRLNHGVLVHCLAGISRSVTVTVAYLMYSMSLSLNDAYDYVKRRKPNVSPNLTFMGQLLDFENALKIDHRLSCPCSCHTNSSSSSSSSSSSYPFSSMSTNSSSSSSSSSTSFSTAYFSPTDQSASANTSGSCRPDFSCPSCACAAYAVNNNSTVSSSSSSSPPSATVTTATSSF